MKIFIWQGILELTDNYHSSGGLVVIAQSRNKALKLAKSKGVKFDKSEEKPDHVLTVTSDEELVIFFPGAGCC